MGDKYGMRWNCVKYDAEYFIFGANLRIFDLSLVILEAIFGH
jgi:hypothetical protein